MDKSQVEDGAWLYTYAEVVELAARLDGLAVDARDPADLMVSLPRVYEGTAHSALVAAVERAMANAFTDHPAKFGAFDMGNRLSSAMGDWPPSFDQVGDGEKNAWSEVASLVTHDLPKVHLGDVLMAVGVHRGHESAEEVAEGYFRLSRTTSLELHYRASCLRRASSLARQFSLESEPKIRESLYAMATAAWSSQRVGVVIFCLEALALPPRRGEFSNPEKGQIVTLADLVSESVHDDLLAEGVYGLRMQLAVTDGDRENARRTLVQSYLGLADSADGLVRHSWLSRAATEAQRLGVTDLYDAAVGALQAMSPEDLGLQAIRSEGTIPRQALEGRMPQYRRARSLIEAFDLWLTTPAPTGSYKRNIRQVESLAGGILEAVTRVTLDALRMPTRTSVGADAAKDEQLERVESYHAWFGGTTLARELMAIRTEHGHCASRDIGVHLATRYRCDLEQATYFGEAINAFWDDRPADAARAAYPLVEAGARGLLLALGEPLYRVQTGSKDGRFPALETYVQRLEKHGLDEDWVRTLRNPVARLRNAIAHGHMLRPSEADAVILLRAAGLLVVLSPANASAADRETIRQSLRDPLAFAAERACLRRRIRLSWAWIPRHARGRGSTS